MAVRFKEVFNHRGFRRYFTNTSWLFLEQVLRIIAGLFVGIYVARYLGPEKFGIYSYSFAFAALFGTIAKLGFDSITVRELVNYPDKRDVYLGTVFWLKIVGGILTLGIIGIAVRFISNDPTTNLYIFIIASGLLFQSFEVVDFYFQSKALSKYVSICKLTQLVLSSFLKLYFIFIRADLFWFVLVSLVDQMSLAISYVFSYWRQRIGMFFGCFHFRIAKEMLKKSWPLIFSGIAVMVYLRVDQIMIKEMLGETEVGLYSAAVKLSEAWYFVPIIVTSSLFPAIINAKKKSSQLYYNRLQNLYTLMVWMAIGLALPMTVYSDQLITFLYGRAFYAAGRVLRIYAWGGVFVFLSAAFGKYLINENMAKKNFYRVSLGAFANIPLNYLFIKNYGICGAAIATLISLFLANYFYDLFDKDLHRQLKLKTFAIINPINIKKRII